jgi:hypothetical protein
MSPNNHHAISRWRSMLTCWIEAALIVSVFWIPVSYAAIPPAQFLQRRAAIGGGVDLRVLPIGEYVQSLYLSRYLGHL